MVKHILTLEGVDTNFLIVDGSGLSRYNMISPSVFIDVYRAAYRNPKFFERFTGVLARPGRGTLKRRFLQYRDYLRAKTGSLRGVTSLTGVLDDRYAFVFIAYGFSGKLSRHRKLQDSIMNVAFQSLLEKSKKSSKINSIP